MNEHQTNFSVTELVILRASAHRQNWRDKDDNYWFQRLAEEFGELGASLAGDHEDPPEWELEQIASICINWLDLRNKRGQTP